MNYLKTSQQADVESFVESMPMQYRGAAFGDFPEINKKLISGFYENWKVFISYRDIENNVRDESGDLVNMGAKPNADALAKRDFSKNPSLYICGGVGIGKTRMLYAILQQSQVDVCHATLVKANVFFKELQALAVKDSSEARSKLMNMADTKGFLLIDDLGSSKISEFVVSEFDYLIDHRYEWGLPTVISSNLSIEDIKNHFSPRIASRLQAGLIFKGKGNDRRLK